MKFEWDENKSHSNKEKRRKKLAKSAKEFDRRFDEGEDIHDLIDMSEAKIIRHKIKCVSP
jgi:hypothetical protein